MAVPVLHVCDKFGVRGSSIHGVSRLFSWWFPRFDPARFDVSLCGLKDPEPASALLMADGIAVDHLGRGPFDPRIVGDLVRLGRRRGARILHVHGYAAANFGRLAARRLGAGLVLHEHFADPDMPFYQGWADRALAGLTDRAVAVSHSTRDFLVEQRHVPARLVRVIFNGAPLEQFAPVPREVALAVRREVGLPENALVVGAVGRLSLQKGHRFLLDAAARTLARHPDAYFLIVGDGDQSEALERQARELGIAHRVVLAGHRSDVPAVLGAIDVLCISSTYEGTPLALFEAMAAGKAIVSTSVDGCSEVLEDGDTALLAPPGDAVALADRLEAALDSADLRARLAARARQESARYDIAACVRALEDLYDEVLAERGAGRTSEVVPRAS